MQLLRPLRTHLVDPCHSQLPVLLLVDVEVAGAVQHVVRLPRLLAVEHRLAQLAPYQLLWGRVSFLWWMHRLDVLLQVELDQVFLSTQVTVEHRACLSCNVHLDLLARPDRENRVDEGADSLVGGSNVVLYCVQVEKLGGAVFALVDVASLPLSLVFCFGVVLPANLQWKLFSTVGTEVFLLAATVLAEFVLKMNCRL